jgi:hypothetical protein
MKSGEWWVAKGREMRTHNRRSQRDGLFTALGSSLWGALPIYAFYYYNTTMMLTSIQPC